MSGTAYILANFGGPRSLEEIEPFLCELLCDQDVVRTPLPKALHRYFFTKVAQKRALRIAPDYQKIGGRSPLFDDTEQIASFLRLNLGAPVLAFHRYLPATHKPFLEAIRALEGSPITVFPLFPQFSYATSGSIARFFQKYGLGKQLAWIPSYPDHPLYLKAMYRLIQEALPPFSQEEELFLLFSAHGLPVKFVRRGDPYQSECLRSFNALSKLFPKAATYLAYQSKFGRGQWLEPSTEEICHRKELWKGKTVAIVPLSFTSDHLETLYEIEHLYLPIIRSLGGKALRIPALSLNQDWLEATCSLIQSPPGLVPNNRLVRNRFR